MDDHLKQYREMISLRGLTDHTIKSYSAYMKVYLTCLSDILHRSPEDVSNSRIMDVTDKKVTFSVRVRKPGEPRRIITLDNTQFIRRYLHLPGMRMPSDAQHRKDIWYFLIFYAAH